MDYKFSSSSPIYLQIVDIVKLNIVSGKWRSGERVQPVRDLALHFGVNPNTMQRALSELERNGLMYTERTAGRYITEDINLIKKERENMAENRINAFLDNMKAIGYSTEEIIELIKKFSAK